jgi:hypothetical protein
VLKIVLTFPTVALSIGFIFATRPQDRRTACDIFGSLTPSPADFWVDGRHGRSENHWKSRLPYKLTLSGIFLLFNMAIIVLPIIPPYKDASGNERKAKGWIFIAVNGAAILCGAFYYVITFSSEKRNCFWLAGVKWKLLEFQTRRERFGYNKLVVYQALNVSVHHHLGAPTEGIGS